MKNIKLKLKNILTEKYKKLLENPDSEQDFCSRTAKGIYQIGHGSIRLMKWLACYDRTFYEKINYCDLTRSILNELSKYTFNCKYISSMNTTINVLNTHITKKSTQVKIQI